MLRSVLFALVVAGVLLQVQPARAEPWGLGIRLGEPSGVDAKFYLANQHAIDAAVAWAFSDGGGVHLQADYIFHNQSFQVEDAKFPLYVGVGARWKINDGVSNQFGVRVPIGLNYWLGNDFDVFIEVAPILDLSPSTEARLNASIGAHYWFGSRSGD